MEFSNDQNERYGDILWPESPPIVNLNDLQDNQEAIEFVNWCLDEMSQASREKWWLLPQRELGDLSPEQAWYNNKEQLVQCAAWLLHRRNVRQPAP